MSFSHLKPGDKVIRLLCGVKMQMVVTNVENGLITVDALDPKFGQISGGWTFDVETGVEEDADLEWGVKFGRTGSYLVREINDGESQN